MNETQELAKFIAALDFDSLPKDVVEVAKDRILDQFGAQLIGSVQSWSKLIYKFAMAQGGKAESTILTYGGRTTVLDTAFVNGCFGHGFEIDDTYRPGGGHYGCTLVPPAVAVGEREHSTGKELITAVVAGYEAGGRLGRAADHVASGRGFHGTATWGHYCAAAAAGKLLGFDDVQMRNAFSITAGDCGGVMQFIRSGDVAVKRLYGGKPAYGGLRAALLAQCGMTGPVDALEGESGVLRAFSNNPNPAEIVRDFGKDWVVVNTAYKHHCCGSLMQGQADCAIILRNRHKLDPGMIERIMVGTTSRGLFIGGSITEPESAGEAQFSTPFIVALALVKGHCGFSAFADENLRDPLTRSVAKKVQVEAVPEFDPIAASGRQPAKVTIALRDGTQFEQILEDYVGTPSNPMTREQVQEKFRDLADAVLPKVKVDAVLATVDRLEHVWDMSILPGLLIV